MSFTETIMLFAEFVYRYFVSKCKCDYVCLLESYV